VSAVVLIDAWPRSASTAFEVADGVEDALTGRVAGPVHLRPCSLTRCDEPRAFQAAVPPVVSAVSAHRLLGESVELHLTPAMLVWGAERDRLLAAEEVVMGFGLDVDDQAFQIEPEVVIWGREFTHLSALCDDECEASPLMVEVSVLDAL
jgi:hypothetical protein